MIRPNRDLKNQGEFTNNYKILFDKSPISITLLDMNGTIVESNSVGSEIWGYTKEEIIGKHFFDLPFICSNLKSMVKKFTEELQKANCCKPREIKITSKSGKKVWISVLATLFRKGNDIYIQVLAQNIDQHKVEVEKLKKTKEIVKEENKKLKKIDEVRKEFIDIAAHELKSPLTSVNGAAQLLDELYKDKMKNDPEFKELVNIINHGCDRLHNLMQNLLDFSNMEANNNTLVIEKIDFVSIIKNCVSAMRYLAEKKKQGIILEIPTKLELNIDKDKIERVLTNLLSNAIKFTPLQGEITIKLKKEGKCAQFSIVDTGIGISKNNLKKLFKKFSRINSSKKVGITAEGTGLGLYLSQGIIDLHGGQIWAESKGKNQGTTFFISLPLN